MAAPSAPLAPFRAGDAVTLSGVVPAENPVAEEPVSKTNPGLGWRKLGLVAVMALGGIGSVIGGNVALAAEPPPAAVTQTVATGQEEALARQAGLSQKAVEALRSDPELRAKAGNLPDGTADMYGSFSSRLRQMIARLLSGKTHVLFMTIDNRDAFVSGRAAGQDAFPHMLNKVEEEARAGRLSSKEAEQMKASIEKLRTLTPQQRDTVATLIQLDQAK